MLTLRGADAAAAAAETQLPDNRSAAKRGKLCSAVNSGEQRSPGRGPSLGVPEQELLYSASYSYLLSDDPVVLAHSPHSTNGYQVGSRSGHRVFYTLF